MVEELVGISDTRAIKRYLEAHRQTIDVDLIESLKKKVDYYIRVDGHRALKLAEITLRAANCLEDAMARALGLRAKAQALHIIANNYEQSLKFYDRAQAIYEKHGKKVEAARVMRAKIDALMYLGRYREALDLAQRARSTFQAHQERALAAQLDTNVGNIYHRLGRDEKALEYYDRAWAFFSTSPDEISLATVEFNRANILVNLDRRKEALAFYGKARARFAAAGMPLATAQLIYNMAYVYFLGNNYPRALALLDEAESLHRPLGDQRHVAFGRLDKMEIYLRVGLFENVAELAGVAENAFRELKMTQETAQAKVLRAIAEMHRSNYACAEIEFLKAAEMFMSEKNEVRAALVYVYLSDLYLKIGDAHKAVSFGNQSLLIFSQHKLANKANYARLMLARALRTAGQGTDALSLCQSILASNTNHDAPWILYPCYHLLGNLLEDENNTAEAHENYTRSIQHLEGMHSDRPADECKTNAPADRLKVYSDLIRLCLRAGAPKEKIAEAFSYIERGRSRRLIDRLANYVEIEIKSERPGDRKLYAECQRVREELNWYYNKVNFHEAKGDPHSVARARLLQQQVRSREKRRLELLRQLQLRGEEYGGLRTVPDLTIEHVQKHLSEEEVLIEYYFAGDGFKVFLVARNDFHLMEVPASRERIDDLLKNLRFQLQKFLYGPDYVQAHIEHLCSSINEYLQQLYSALVQPIRPLIEGKRLIIVPCDLLQGLPFHALYDGASYVIDGHEVSYAPSAHLLALCRGKAPAGATDALVMGIGNDTGPDIAEEINAVKERLGRAQIFEGDGATRERLEQQAPGARLIHLAAPVRFRSDNPMFSTIRLADAQLSFFDIYKLRLTAHLVTLSGCGIGWNSALAGDEMLGLAHSFLYAGAAALLVSLWVANDRATAEFMSDFYGRLNAGVPKRTALRQAQGAMKERYKHPYYWAPFFLIG
jgi:CHAT domain-containing protein/predicted negative regulator of RcsB-dependent stress response